MPARPLLSDLREGEGAAAPSDDLAGRDLRCVGNHLVDFAPMIHFDTGVVDASNCSAVSKRPREPMTCDAHSRERNVQKASAASTAKANALTTRDPRSFGAAVVVA
jgi:hypothetical protein